MNIFEVIAILGILAGLALGIWFAADGGMWAALLGALKGAAIAYGAFVVAMIALLAVLALGLRYRPAFPRCKNGCCGQTDYRYLDEKSPESVQHQALLKGRVAKLMRCGCATLYLNSLGERRFFEVLDDGTLLPHMRHSPFGRWQPDAGDAPGGAATSR